MCQAQFYFSTKIFSKADDSLSRIVGVSLPVLYGCTDRKSPCMPAPAGFQVHHTTPCRRMQPPVTVCRRLKFRKTAKTGGCNLEDVPKPAGFPALSMQNGTVSGWNDTQSRASGGLERCPPCGGTAVRMHRGIAFSREVCYTILDVVSSHASARSRGDTDRGENRRAGAQTAAGDSPGQTRTDRNRPGQAGNETQ